MDASIQAIPLGGPRVDLAAMSAIVREMIAGNGQSRDDYWLHRRAAAAGLGAHACAALGALQAHLREGATVSFTTIDALLSNIDGNWV